MPTDHRFWWSQGVNVSLTPPNAPDSAQYISLTLRAPQVFGVVKDPFNTPVFEAHVKVLAANGVRRDELTDPLGRFAIDDLPTGMTATVSVEPPIGFGWMIEPPDQVVNLPSVNALMFTLGLPNKTLMGTVRTNEVISQPVSNALVTAHRVDRPGRNDTTTDATGHYSMSLAPGLWDVKIKSISITTPTNWYYPFETRLVEFGCVITPEVKTMNFLVVVADAHVSGHVQLPDTSPPPFTVAVLLHSDEGIGAETWVDVMGNYALDLPHGTYRMDLRVESPLFAAPPLPPIRARSDVPTVVPTITLLPRDVIIKGNVSDSVSSAPVGDIHIIAWTGRAATTRQPMRRGTTRCRSRPACGT